jgi:hypothetical protein
MTRNVKLIGVLAIIIIATTGCFFAHRHIKEAINNAKMKKQANAMEFRHMRGMGRGQMGPGRPFMYRGQMNGRGGNNRQQPEQGMMRGGMRMGPGNDMRGGVGMGPDNGMRRGRGMGMEPGNGMRRGMGQKNPGQMNRDMMIGRIPNLTDKQRKEFADLRLKQMEEMNKIREESVSKMQSLREANRTKMMSLLTDEQKKLLESGPSAPRQAKPPVTK